MCLSRTGKRWISVVVSKWSVFQNTVTYLLLYQSLYDLTNPIGHNLISVLGLTNLLGHKLISALVLTSHLKWHTIFLILLCLAAPFFSNPRLFLLGISLIFVINQLLLEYYNIGRNADKTGSM